MLAGAFELLAHAFFFLLEHVVLLVDAVGTLEGLPFCLLLPFRKANELIVIHMPSSTIFVIGYDC